ncbi:MAG: hypothetical protein PVF65_00195 [Sphingomonadales bacterium]
MAVVFGACIAVVIAGLLIALIVRRRARKPTRIRWFSIVVFAFISGFVATVLWSVFDQKEMPLFENFSLDEGLSAEDGVTEPQPQL